MSDFSDRTRLNIKEFKDSNVHYIDVTQQLSMSSHYVWIVSTHLVPQRVPGGGSQDTWIFLGPVDLALAFRGDMRRPPGLLAFWFMKPMSTLGTGRKEKERTDLTFKALLKTHSKPMLIFFKCYCFFHYLLFQGIRFKKCAI